MRTNEVYFHHMTSPVGTLCLYADSKNLLALTLGRLNKNNSRIKMSGPWAPLIERRSPVLRQTERQLAEYFKGKRVRFEIALNPAGTDFQKKAWAVLCRIPFGTTLSYKTQAAALGSPRAFRAVGSANAKNPIPIIIPCHRVIASNGKLSGYSGGEKIKEALLRFEKAKTGPVYGHMLQAHPAHLD